MTPSGAAALERSASMHCEAAAARQALYMALSEIFSYPAPELLAEIRSGALARRMTEIVSALPYSLPLDQNSLRAKPEALGSEFIRLFELAAEQHPCPLYGGALSGDRRAVMEELLRYYRHFGLSVARAELRDLPDSIPTVLEFLAVLTFRESRATPSTARELRAAQADLLERHLAGWAATIRERVEQMNPPELYQVAAELLDGFAHLELACLKGQVP